MTLIDNINRLKEAKTQIQEALAGKGATVPSGIRLSDLSEIAYSLPKEVIDKKQSWGRSPKWPRIDLIPMRGLDYHVIYLVVRHPGDTGHGLCLNASTANKASTWYIEIVDVSEDGQVITPVDGTRQTAESGSTLEYEFPADDPEGTIYALKIAVTDPTVMFSTTPHITTSQKANAVPYSAYYASTVMLEAVVRTPGIAAMDASSGLYQFAGPRHIVYYKADHGIYNFMFRGNQTLQLVEFREGSVLKYTSNSMPQFYSASGINADWDDDFVVQMHPTSLSFGQRYLPPKTTGEIYPISDVKSTAAPTEAVDWSASVSFASMFAYNVELTALSLPDGFASNATSLVGMFINDVSLMQVDLPDNFGSAADSLGNCFYNCAALETIALPAGCGQSASSFANMFLGCTSLTSISFPEEFGQHATNVAACFNSCTQLVDINRAPAFKISFSFANSPNLSHDSLLNILNTLQTITTAQTLSLGSANLKKLTDAEKKIATDKGWTLA